MKSLFLILITLFFVAKSKAQTITLSGKNMPLKQVLAAVKKQTGYFIIYPKGLLDNAKPITVDQKQVALNIFLHIIFKDQPYSFVIDNKSIFISSKTVGASSNPTQTENLTGPGIIDIKGRIINEKDEPVIATIMVKGTNASVGSNANGEFVLKGIDQKSMLIITGIAIQPYELKVEGRKELVIKVKNKIAAQEEVTVINTGYQQLNKERFVGSVTVIDSALFHRQVSTDILSRLDGIANGLLFDRRNTGPDAIQIRGLSTLPGNGTSSAPLIILDNFPYKDDINNINPSDVETVNILKDAAAASIWGARAGNGVIVITTKKGKYNQPFHLSISSNVRIQQKPNLFYSPQMSTSDFIDVEKFLFDKGFYNSDLTNNTTYPLISPVVEMLNKKGKGFLSATEAGAQIDALRSLDVRNDYEKYVFREAISRQYFLNFSGGSNQVKYAVSVGYDRNKNNIQGSDGGYNRYTINSNTSFKPFRALELSAGINFSQGTTKSGGLPYPLSTNSSRNSIYPYAQLADADGNFLPVAYAKSASYLDTVGGGKLLDWHYYPLKEIRLQNNVGRDQRIAFNSEARIRITSWLNSAVSFQYSQETANTRNLQGQQTWFTRDLINRYTNPTAATVALRYPIPLGGILDIGNSEGTTLNIREQLNFNKTWQSAHNLSAMVAGETSESKGRSLRDRFFGFDDELGTYATSVDYSSFFPLYGQSGSAQINDNHFLEEGSLARAISFLANLSYAYRDRYRFYASARKDGANIYGVKTNNKWKPLWSIGTAWDISKESFYNVRWLPSLQIKASYGFAGNSNDKLIAVSTIGYILDNPYTDLPTARPNNPANPSLRWEEVGTLNIGIGFSVSKRISGSLDWYQKRSRDVIALVPINPTLGLEEIGVYRNVAHLKGRGIDIAINTKNLTGLFQWTTTFNFNYAETIVTKYFQNITQISNALNIGINPIEGKTAYALYSYRWMGLDPATGDPQGSLNKQVSKDYTTISRDLPQNQVFHGSSQPLYFGNILNSFSWKGFSFSVNISYRLAYYFRRSTISYTSLFNWGGHTDYALRWQKSGDEMHTTVPSMTYPADGRRDAFYAGSEVTVERGDHIRLQDIRVSYNWENKNKLKLPVQSIQFFIYPASLNLILWKANKSNLDPDYLSGNSFNLPPPRIWAAGLTANF